MALPLRHELKFYITRTQYEVLSRVLRGTLKLDPHAAKRGGEYAIRSLYFDTVFDDAYYDKISGVKDRDKYRMRIYNYSDSEIFMECKTKVGSYISRRSQKIPRDLADQLIAADPTGVENTASGLLRYTEHSIPLASNINFMPSKSTSVFYSDSSSMFLIAY